MKLRIAVLALLLAATCHAAQWTKYVAPDKSYSVHVPVGWTVTPADPVLQVDNPKSGEQLVLIAATADEGATAQAMAEKLLAALQKAEPSLKITQWNDLGEKGEFAFADLAYSDGDKPFVGNLVVAVGGGGALWFDYTAAEADYSRLRAKALLDGFINSFEGDASSKLPQVEIPDLQSARLDRDAGAFIFVLEFGCGTAFTEGQERAIREEVVKAWREIPEAEVAKYDKYPGLMKVILSLKQDQLASLQAELKQSVQGILAETDTSPAIKIIRDQLARSTRVAVAGTPPLTAAAVDGYAELMAFAQAMAQNPAAGPEDIDDTVARQTRADLVKVWPSFTDDDKQAVLSAPALWMSVRMTFRQGTAEEKQAVRASLRKLVAAATPPAATGNNQGGQPAATGGGGISAGTTADLTRRYVQHQTLMMMQQQTFNTYMWSRGFAGWTPAGKMW